MSRLGHMEYKYVVALVAVIGMFMELLDSTVVNVAIPVLAKDFHATTTTIEWVITGYLLSLAVFIPVSGWAGDTFGTKRTYLFALTMFTTASGLCAFAWNVESLIFFRILQGVGGGMMTPVGMAMMFRAFPPHERSKAAGFMVIPTTVAPASGPIVGGFLIEYVSWEWIFLVNIPVGIGGILFCLKSLREHKEPSAGSFDPYGFVLGAAGMATLLYALAEAGPRGWGDARVLLFLVAGVSLLAAFALVELRIAQPMLDLRLFRDRLFRTCFTVQFVAFIGFSGALFLLPIYLQAARGLTAFESGLTSFPMAIGVMSTAQPASRLYRRVGPRRLIFIGLVLASLSSFLLALTDLQTSLWEIRAMMLLRGFGFGFMIVSLQAATFGTIAPAATGRASSIYSSGRMVAQSLGVAFLATVLTNRISAHGGALPLTPRATEAVRDATVAGFRDGFVVAGIAALFGVVAALIIRDRDAAVTMRPHTVTAARGDEETAAAAH